jgi:4-hydroxybenzoyl-CoA thioesterase
MKIHTHDISVEWGDCDPAGIVFYPNYYRWMDEATFHLFDSVGYGWDEIREKFGAPGLPLISTHAEYRIPGFFGDKMSIEVGVSEWGTKSMTVSHRFLKDGKLAVEGWEKRIWSEGDPGDGNKIVTAPIPEEVKIALSADISENQGQAS